MCRSTGIARLCCVRLLASSTGGCQNWRHSRAVTLTTVRIVMATGVPMRVRVVRVMTVRARHEGRAG